MIEFDKKASSCELVGRYLGLRKQEGRPWPSI
jgi:hypothetical protein